MTARHGTKDMVMTITAVEVDLPEYQVERYEGSGPDHVTRTQYTVLPDGETRIELTTTFTVPWWNPLLALALRAVAPRSMAGSLARIKELVDG
ncbi:MAG: hypothetical protein GX593_10095 [Actinomycetales bacterium]|nr:hypothetical protein [Actinomycetales bacterium]